MGELVKGLRVCDVRGLVIGEVEDVRGNLFAVSHDSGIIWLPIDSIWTIDSGSVTLEFNLSSLARRRVKPPEDRV